MKKICLLTAFAFIATFYCQSQGMNESWARTAGGAGEDAGTTIAVDHHGGVYIAGSFTSPVFSIGNSTLINAGGKDIFIAKYDTAGNFLWAQRYGGSGNESVRKMALSSDGSIYLTDSFATNFTLGTTVFTPTSFSNTYVAKLNATGVFQWAKQITGSTINPDIVTDQAGAICFVAETGSAIGTSSANLLFQKYAANGTALFSKTVVSGYFMGSLLPHIAVDWSNYIHIDFYHGLTYQTVNWYDAAGNELGSRSSYGVPRNYSRSYKARSVSDYYASSEFITLNGSRNIELHHNTQTAPAFGGCTKFALNTDIDDMGNQFLVGYITDSLTTQPCTGNATLFSGNYSIQGTTGWDAFFTRKNANASTIDYLGSTKNNGNTNEYPNQMVIDTGGNSMYIIGSWAKRADTSKFRFGNSELTHSTIGRYNKDVLFLKLQNPLAILSANAGYDVAICGGATQLSGSANGGAGNFTYSWSPATGLSNTSIANPVAHPTVSTTYVLTVTDAMGRVARDSVRVLINPGLYKPTIALASGSINPFCEGQFIVLLTDNAVAYQWSNGSVSNGITVSKSDTITVTTVNTQGCVGKSDPYIAVMKPRPPAPVITPIGNTQNTIQSCIGSTVTLTAQSTQSSVAYLWNNGAITPSITTQTNGVFGVSVIADGCTSLNTFRQVVFYNKPTGTITANGSANLCSGDSVQLTVATADTVSVLWNTGAVSKSIWVKAAGTYSAQLGTQHGCTAAATNPVTVQVFLRPTPSIIQSSNTLTAMPAAAFYQWYLNNNAINGATAQIINITVGGNYSVRVTDANGCSSATFLNAVLRIVSSELAYQVYPNPTKDKIGIVYSLPHNERVTITMKSLDGRTIKTVVNGIQQTAGSHQYIINTHGLPNGLVIVEFRIGDKAVQHKQIIL